MELEQFINKLKYKYYNNILNYMNEKDIKSDWLNDHITSLNLNNYSDNESATFSSGSSTDNIVDSSQTNNQHNNIFSDDLLYKKPWTKLNPIHKILKIKEFVNGLKINIEENRSILKDDLILLIKNKILTKKDSVNYDEINGKIISLKKLEYKDGLYKYNN